MHPPAAIWRVRLFDGPVLERIGGEQTVRFRSSKVQGLLAYLALHLGHRCAREAIADALWPDEIDAAVTANRLRVTLASLRRQIEPPGTPFGIVLDASVPGCIRLRESTVTCDVAEFDLAYDAGRLDEAAALLCGPLLPGLYDEWVNPEQTRFELLRDELAGLGHRPSRPTEPSSPAVVSPHRLPLYLTNFLGRETERHTLEARLQEARLVTLTGPGGIGKTRLAVETAEAGSRPAVFVSLAEMDAASRIPDAILQAMGHLSRTDAAPLAHLIDYLRDRGETLLVLDNADRLVEAVAAEAMRLLGAVPGLRVLVTSRQRLEVPGEAVVALAPLVTPSEGDGLEALLASPSAALFSDRARNAVPDFVVRPHHVAPIIAICRRLEGMPLALELAAARVAVQSPGQIATALEERALDLRSRQRGLSERHRSLRSAIQGGFDLLSPELRRLFARLSVFRGGWTARAAAYVCGAPQAEALLEDLVVRSLVNASEDEATGEVRYAFLAPLRDFAAEMLPVDEAGVCRARHTAFFLALASVATEDDLRTLAPLDAEGENLRLALAPVESDPLFWPGLAGALIHAFVRGHHRQALGWIEATAPLVADVPDPEARFRWRYAACQILPDVGRLDETEAIAKDMAVDAEARGDERSAVYAAVIQSYIEDARGLLDASLATSLAALARARALGDRHLLETCLSHRSGTLHVYGESVGRDAEPGRIALAEAEGLARELRTLVPPHSRRLALAPLLIAGAVWPQGRLEEAYGFFKEAQAAAVRLGTTTELMYALVSEAVISAEWGFSEHAAALYGAFELLQERMGYSLERAQSSRPPWIEGLAVNLCERLGSEAFRVLAAQGRALPPAVLAARRVFLLRETNG